MKANKALEELFGKLIHAYTRKQAIADRVLFDVTAVSAVFAGTTCPVAVTAAARDALTEAAARAEGPLADRAGLAQASLCFALVLMGEEGRKAEGAEFRYTVNMREESVNLRALLHGDDEGKPCVTLMLASED